MKAYNTVHLVKSEDLNHHGTLYAARTASWVVEAAFVAAACSHGNPDEILCRNMHGLSFSMPLNLGDIVRFEGRIVKVGRTSMTVHVRVASELKGVTAVEGFLTFVTVDKATGKPKPHGLVLDVTGDPDELAAREAADNL